MTNLKNYEEMTLKEKYKAFTIYDKYKDSFSEQEKIDFSMTSDELAELIDNLNQMESKRRTLNANRKAIIAERKQLQSDKKILQLQIKEQELNASEKEHLKSEILELSNKIKGLKEQSAEITRTLKEALPSLSEIQKTRNKYRKLIGFKLISGKKKAKQPEVVKKVLDDARESNDNVSENNIVDITSSAENIEGNNVVEPTTPPEELVHDNAVIEKVQQPTIDESETNKQIFTPENPNDVIISDFSSNKSAYNDQKLKELIEINADRKVIALRYSYIEPELDLKGRVIDGKLKIESFDEKDSNGVIFAKNPIKAYRKALKHKIRLIKRMHLLDDNIDLNKIEKRLENEFKELFLKSEDDLCIERYTTIKAVLTKSEILSVFDNNQYPFDFYNPCKASFVPVKKSILSFIPITFEKVTINIGDLHPERKCKYSSSWATAKHYTPPAIPHILTQYVHKEHQEEIER